MTLSDSKWIIVAVVVAIIGFLGVEVARLYSAHGEHARVLRRLPEQIRYPQIASHKALAGLVGLRTDAADADGALTFLENMLKPKVTNA